MKATIRLLYVRTEAHFWHLLLRTANQTYNELPFVGE